MIDMDFDILICGGGLVGSALALALQNTSLKIAVVDRTPLDASHPETYQDARSIALSLITQRIFKGLGLWDVLASRAYPIQAIHVSEKGGFGFTRILAKDLEVDALGSVIELSELQRSLHQALQQHSTITRFTNTTYTAINFLNDGRAEILLTDAKGQKCVTARMVICADGTHSGMQKLLGIGVRTRDYDQHALTANIGLVEPPKKIGVAYERFTKSGPLAMLPLGIDRYNLVWTLPSKKVEHYLQYPDTDFLSALQQTFGFRLGRFAWVGRRSIFPLQLTETRVMHTENIIFIGNARQSLHPVAGQGFNLGLRDAAVLADLIKQFGLEKREQLLKQYSDLRSDDHSQTIQFTHGLVKLFANDVLTLKLLRNCGLVGLDIIPALKRRVARKNMGFHSGMTDLQF